ncbi:MAG: precorrin-3B C(17)-methyltransferase [Lachnospiraceae bacterium]|nr:precorrin-3B C(17)-methyltransferase [Lachnospiraceae bacterium]
MGNLIYIVGIGPGEEAGMTAQARAALEQSDVIIGYTLYVKLVEKNFPEKEFMTTGMRQEIERCRLCFEKAGEGKTVALICSGDAGVYGMASPMYELSREYPEVELVVIPGITAANSGAAVLGAPLNHDYCLISLSDLMTPWSVIEKRLQAAILGDFAIALYNPSSKKRADYLKRACRIMLEAGARPERACGYVENIGREGTKSCVCTLEELSHRQVNMFTTVFIGNSGSYMEKGHLITKRGYEVHE